MKIVSHTINLSSFILKDFVPVNKIIDEETHFVKIANPSKNLFYFEPEINIVVPVRATDYFADIKISSLLIFESSKNPAPEELYNLFETIHVDWNKIIEERIAEEHLSIELPEKITSYRSMYNSLAKALKKMNSIKN